MNDIKKKEQKLYYIEVFISVEVEDVELMSFEDAQETLEHCQLLQPENRYVIQEFESI